MTDSSLTLGERLCPCAGFCLLISTNEYLVLLTDVSDLGQWKLMEAFSSLWGKCQPNETGKFGAWHLNWIAKLDNFLLQKLCAIIIWWYSKKFIISTDLLFLPSPAFNHLATIAVYQERHYSHLFKRPVWLVQNRTQFPNQQNMMHTAAPAM